MLTGDSLINVSCSEKAQAACRFIQAQENGPGEFKGTFFTNMFS